MSAEVNKLAPARVLIELKLFTLEEKDKNIQ